MQQISKDDQDRTEFLLDDSSVDASSGPLLADQLYETIFTSFDQTDPAPIDIGAEAASDDLDPVLPCGSTGLGWKISQELISFAQTQPAPFDPTPSLWASGQSDGDTTAGSDNINVTSGEYGNGRASRIAGAAAVGPQFIQIGPSPQGTSGTYATTAGAIETIVTDPADANTLWLGSVDGGIWVTHNGGVSWTPLTDKQASLSIASLSLDPTDTTHNTLIAGIGLASSGSLGTFGSQQGFFLGDGGQRTGLLYSTDGGTTWTPLGGATLSGQSVVGVAARGQVLLAATFEPWSYWAQYTTAQGVGGLYRSINSGASFVQVGTSSGFASGPVTSLIGDPMTPSTLYAAVTSTTSFAATAVYVSTDTGATWTQIFGAAQSGGVIGSANQTIARVAVNASLSEIAVGVLKVDSNSRAALAGLYLSSDNGSSWTNPLYPHQRSTRTIKASSILRSLSIQRRPASSMSSGTKIQSPFG